MSWPFPVIGISSKFSDAVRWCSYQSNIREILIYKVIIFVSAVKRPDRHGVLSSFIIFLFNQSDFFINGRLTFFLAHHIIHLRKNTFTYVIHPYKETHGEAFWLKLFTVICCPEAISKVIVFGRRKTGYRAIATVMVC